MSERVTFNIKVINKPAYIFRLEGITLVFVFVLISAQTLAAENIILRESYAGNLSFALTGNTMRSGSNGCSLLNNSSAAISIPASSNVVAAFLYWSGSGSNDTQVNFSGANISADVIYNENIDGLSYYSARADVTNRVSSVSATYNVSGLNFDRSSSYCTGGRSYGGWALVIVYENAQEPLRVVNIFDGFRNFWNNSITLTPNNFVVADNPAALGGKHAHITWEGDADISNSENLRFNGSVLSGSGNPQGNQFNSYSNSTASSTSGVDVDIYNIGNYLTAGSQSVTSVYTSGQDRVYLSAEIISIPNRDVADLSLTVNNPATVQRGDNAVLALRVTNNGPRSANAVQVEIPLTDGLSLSSFSGNNWLCSSQSNAVICQLSNLANNQYSDLSVTLSTAATTLNSESLSISTSSNTFDHRMSNNSQQVTLAIVDPDLSTSVKRVLDLNGGQVRPDDTLRFEIEITNSGAAVVSNMTLTDHIPSLISSFQVFSHPVGAQLTTQPAPAGNFGRGVVSLSALTIPAGESRILTIDGVLSSGAQDSDSFTNTAILSGSGLNLSLTSPIITVNSALSIKGNKPLYLQPNLTLTRVATTDSSSAIEITNNSTVNWQLTPALQTDMVLNYSQGIPFRFYARNGYDGGDNRAYNHTFDIRLSARRSGTDILLASQTLTAELLTAGNTSGLEVIREFNTDLSVQNAEPLLNGDILQISIRQSGSQYSDPVDLFLRRNGNNSQVALTSNTVINVDSVALYDAPYPGGNTLNAAQRGQVIYIRGEVSDPFGADDITAATLSLFDPSGNQLLNNTALTPVAASNAVKVYEYSITMATDASAGNWKASIRAEEGYENLVFSSKDLSYPILLFPQLNLTKNAEVISDPVNGSTNPKAIPGAEIIYTLTALNQGEGQTDADTLVIDEQIAATTSLYVADFNGAGPAEFIQGAANSGLTYGFSALNAANDDLDFSNDTDSSDGITYGYVPQPDAEGFDANVTYIRFMPKGTLNPASGSSQPEFKFRYKVKVQ